MGICNSNSINKYVIKNDMSILLKKNNSGDVVNIDRSNYLTINNNKNNKTYESKITKYDDIYEVNLTKNDETKIQANFTFNNNELIITSEQLENIAKQSKIYICKFYAGTKIGTGFLCKIPFPDKFNCLPVLMTNNHVINEKEIINSKILKIRFDKDETEKIIIITPERRIYSSSHKEGYDLTIIEIFPERDKIFHFFEMDILDIEILKQK